MFNAFLEFDELKTYTMVTIKMDDHVLCRALEIFKSREKNFTLDYNKATMLKYSEYTNIILKQDNYFPVIKKTQTISTT